MPAFERFFSINFVLRLFTYNSGKQIQVCNRNVLDIFPWHKQSFFVTTNVLIFMVKNKFSSK
jgi:hypothetical protein